MATISYALICAHYGVGMSIIVAGFDAENEAVAHKFRNLLAKKPESKTTTKILL